MYWAKKILEWSPSVASAYQRAIWLNDRYELRRTRPPRLRWYRAIDAGRVAQPAWALVGKHDRPWFDRPIFGQVRYMSLASTGRKFDAKRYIKEVDKLEGSCV